MMGLAASRVAAACGVASPPVLHFLAHYAVNIVWAPIFFGLQRLRPALFMNYALTISVGVLIAQYCAAVSAATGLLLLPYALWLLFATALNFRICALNPGAYNNARWQADLSKLQSRAASVVA